MFMLSSPDTHCECGYNTPANRYTHKVRRVGAETNQSPNRLQETRKTDIHQSCTHISLHKSQYLSKQN